MSTRFSVFKERNQCYSLYMMDSVIMMDNVQGSTQEFRRDLEMQKM